MARAGMIVPKAGGAGAFVALQHRAAAPLLYALLLASVFQAMTVPQ